MTEFSKNFTEILRTATSKIDEGYFKLKIDRGRSKYRERVYCYELYHQMRCLWPSSTDYWLMGEVSKAGHPLLKESGMAGYMPDFLVHRPGNRISNHTIIEVKHRQSNAGIKSDLKKLSKFRRLLEYERAIFLMYGHNINSGSIEEIESCWTEVTDKTSIEVWLHDKVGKPTRHYRTLA